MNTKILLGSSAVFLWLMAIVISFFPEEIYDLLNQTYSRLGGLALRILGSFYFAMAIINWMSKGSLIGGIYNKPIAFGNLMHFGITAVALIKISFKFSDHLFWWIALSVIYVIFSIGFIYVFNKTPKAVKQPI